MAKDNYKDIHVGHRERLKNRFLNEGLDDFEKHNILELLLFYAIPRVDTNEIAHDLIREFGSLSEVMNANFDDLVKVDRITPNAAVLLKLIPSLARAYLTDKSPAGEVFDSAEKAASFSSRSLRAKPRRLSIFCVSTVRLTIFPATRLPRARSAGQI